MSLWYAAHIVMYVRRKHKPLPKVPVWENIILIKAESEEEAFAKAEERGKQDASDKEDDFLWAGEPAEWVFAGVRKLTLCEDAEKRPGEGTEVSYLEMELPSEPSRWNWLDGKPTNLKSTDLFAEPLAPSERPVALKTRA
ncbi:MAG: DUF4288 domain-containing protein [Planctomycetes bacterium]|nr:DUF4288 domain-containing protein [Planctomycetota bacterium]